MNCFYSVYCISCSFMISFANYYDTRKLFLMPFN